MDYIDTERKARKPHRCFMCGCTIDVGTKYIRQFVPEYRSADCIHKECCELLSYEGFYNEDEYGTDDDFFLGAILDFMSTSIIFLLMEKHLTKVGMVITITW